MTRLIHVRIKGREGRKGEGETKHRLFTMTETAKEDLLPSVPPSLPKEEEEEEDDAKCKTPFFLLLMPGPDGSRLPFQHPPSSSCPNIHRRGIKTSTFITIKRIKMTKVSNFFFAGLGLNIGESLHRVSLHLSRN